MQTTHLSGFGQPFLSETHGPATENGKEYRQITLGELRRQITDCVRFRLMYYEPLYPLSVDALFSRAHICAGANASISLVNVDITVVVTHIQKIEECRDDFGVTYFIHCLDHSDEKPVEVTYELLVV